MGKPQFNSFLRHMPFIAVLFMALPLSSQTFFHSQEDHDFRMVGVASNGTVVVLASVSDENAVVYEFSGTNVGIIPLSHLDSSGSGDKARMSRDGEWVTGEADVDGRLLPTLWSRSRPAEFIAPELPGDSRAFPRDVASTSDGPLVACNRFPTSFLWTLHEGLTPWITNTHAFLSWLTIHRFSRDGDVFVGRETLIRKEGDPAVDRVFVGTRTNFVYISPRNGSIVAPFAMSPNGRFVSGIDDSIRAVLWQDGRMRRLPFGKRGQSYSDTVTDHGFAGGVGEEGAMIYDPRSRKAWAFAKWWARQYPQAPLPGTVRRIRDLHEDGGNLYLLLSMRDDELELNFSVMAIAPINGLHRAFLSDLKGRYGRASKVPGRLGRY